MVFAGHQPLEKLVRINTAGSSPSTQVPYPVFMVENKLQTALDESRKENSHSNTASCDLLDTYDQKSPHQMSSPNELHTFTLAQLKQEISDVKEESELDEESNVKSVMDSKHDTSNTMNSIRSTDTKTSPCPEKTISILPVTSLKEEETTNTQDPHLSGAEKVRAGSRASSIPLNAVARFSCHMCGKYF